MSFATTTTELENQKSDLQDKIDETSSEMAGVHSKMTNALNEVNKLCKGEKRHGNTRRFTRSVKRN